MTVRINFLPRNYQPPKQMGSKEVGIAAAVVTGIVAAGVFYMGVHASTTGLERQMAMNQMKLQNVRTQLVQATDLKVREDRVTKAELELKSLTGRHWSSLLLTLRELTPTHVTWTTVTVKDDAVTLKGTTRGLVDLAQLFGGLLENADVDTVSLKYIDEKGIPITRTVKAGEKPGTLPEPAKADPPPAGAPAKPVPVDAPKLMFNQLEFELTATLKPVEGRTIP
jgi:Tfp pilus assembly protein PilN